MFSLGSGLILLLNIQVCSGFPEVLVLKVLIIKFLGLEGSLREILIPFPYALYPL